MLDIFTLINGMACYCRSRNENLRLCTEYIQYLLLDQRTLNIVGETGNPSTENTMRASQRGSMVQR